MASELVFKGSGSKSLEAEIGRLQTELAFAKDKLQRQLVETKKLEDKLKTLESDLSHKIKLTADKEISLNALETALLIQ